MVGSGTFSSCRLTGAVGRMVKSHIIPECLTTTVRFGQPLVQSDQSGRPIRRWTSWYDQNLVTQEGENILQHQDNKAIEILRRHKMIWSSWGPMIRLSAKDHSWHRSGDFGVRYINNIDSGALRMFFLSVLWRGVASSLWEFERIIMPPEKSEKLRQMVLNSDPRPYDFLPISLIQLSSITEPFNQAISFLNKRIPKTDKAELDFENGFSVDFYRIYMDGLVANIDIDTPFGGQFYSDSQFHLGSANEIAFTTFPAEKSVHVREIQLRRELGALEVNRPLVYSWGLPVRDFHATSSHKSIAQALPYPEG